MQGIANLSKREEDTNEKLIVPQKGIGTLNDQAEILASYGRNGDIYVVHAAEGETVVPMEVFEKNPRLKDMVWQQLREMDLDPERYVVGNELNSINPHTGQPEFFLGGLFKAIGKVLKPLLPVIGAVVGGMIPGIGIWLGPALGSFLGSKLAGQSTKQALFSGIFAGATAGLAAGTTAAQAGAAAKGAQAGITTQLAAGIKEKGIGSLFSTAAPAINMSAAIPSTLHSTLGIKAAVKPTIWSGLKTGIGAMGNKVGAFAKTGQGMFTIGAMGLAGLTAKQDGQGGPDSPDGKVPLTGWDLLQADMKNLNDPRGQGVSNSSVSLLAERENQLNLPSTSLINAPKPSLQPVQTPPSNNINPLDPNKFYRSMRPQGMQPQGMQLQAMQPQGMQLQAMQPQAMQPQGMGIQTLNNYNPFLQPREIIRASVGGEIVGEGNGTSDDIPAMLSDGEFVMTAKAVKNAGEGDRKKGANRLYKLMKEFEG